MSLVVIAALFGAASGAFLPRLTDRFAVASGVPARRHCPTCRRRYPIGRAGWVRAGRACPCAPWWTVLRSTTVTAATTGVLAAAFGAVPVLPVLLPAAVLGVLLARVDLRCHRLPDPLVALLAVLTAGPLVLVGAADPARLGRSLLAAALTGAAYLTVALLPGGGLGFGDVKLAAVLGFVLGYAGWPAVAVGVVTPHLLNGPVAVALLVTGRARRDTALPFGPALLVGALSGLAA